MLYLIFTRYLYALGRYVTSDIFICAAGQTWQIWESKRNYNTR